MFIYQIKWYRVDCLLVKKKKKLFIPFVLILFFIYFKTQNSAVNLEKPGLFFEIFFFGYIFQTVQDEERCLFKQ